MAEEEEEEEEEEAEAEAERTFYVSPGEIGEQTLPWKERRSLSRVVHFTPAANEKC